eukprot:gnl/TRDRNA2_/TRDRNA2_155587_c0_seq1.p1 gnl/TRDRNA2_/TRDRNA2_155587_c0~~gnl/TRDRNA2_/TRDRNA2_155587_c0_seq1.p1  ORF type:complete len:248 (-),score=46.58 gnl/TRDRNA2_/TRDRNA2_155587_c0_seq1:53-796(-)
MKSPRGRFDDAEICLDGQSPDVHGGSSEACQKLTHVVSISEEQHQQLEVDFAEDRHQGTPGYSKAVASTPLDAGYGRSASGGNPASGGRDCESGWESFYDNAAMAITLRGWWLREFCGKWTLLVPTSAADTSVPFTTYTELTALDDILEKLGLCKYAEALKKGLDVPVERLLAQAGVRRFARIHVERRRFSGCLNASSLVASRLDSSKAIHADSSGPQVQFKLSLERLKFDASHAENKSHVDEQCRA